MAQRLSPIDHARALANRGRLSQAVKAYGKAITGDAGNCDLLTEAGVTAAQAQDYASARKWLAKACALAPKDAAIRLNAGEVARLAGQFEEAESHFRAASEIAPGDADAWFGLGDALSELKRHDEAIAALRHAHKLAPGDREIMHGLAGALTEAGVHGEARELYRQAVELYRHLISAQPDDHQAWCNMAVSLLATDEFDGAVKAFARAEEIAAVPDILLTRWARTLLNARLFPEAIEKAELAIDRHVRGGAAQYVKGSALQFLGRFDEAEAAFREALKVAPELSEAYEQLSRMGRFTAADVAPAQGIADDGALRDAARIPAAFALSRHFDRDGDIADGFAYLALANTLKSRSVPFIAEKHDAFIARLMEVFDRDFFEARKGQGNGADGPIFIFGLPRSGTTLCEQVLAGIPDVFAGGERLDIQDLIEPMAGYPEDVLELDAGWARENADAVLAEMRGAAAGESWITNKTPGNYLAVGFICWLFPNARLINCRRDPRDLGLSCYEQNFRNGLSFTYDLEAFAVAYRGYEKLMAHWHEMLPGAMLDVQYEALVAKPEEEARKLVEFCKFDWNPAYLDTHKVERPVDTASFWQVRQPINTKSVGKWRRYEKYLGPLIKALDA